METSKVLERMRKQAEYHRDIQKRQYEAKNAPRSRTEKKKCPECGLMVHEISNPCSLNPLREKYQKMTDHLEADSELKAYLSTRDHDSQPIEQATYEIEDPRMTCIVCKKQFKNRTGYLIHMYRVHTKRNGYNQYRNIAQLKSGSNNPYENNLSDPEEIELFKQQEAARMRRDNEDFHLVRKEKAAEIHISELTVKPFLQTREELLNALRFAVSADDILIRNNRFRNIKRGHYKSGCRQSHSDKEERIP